VRLSEAAVGTRVRIRAVHFPPELQGRMLGLGFVPGSVVEVVREAPFGDPRVYLVRGKLITLRRSEADFVEVEPLDKVIPLSMAQIGKDYLVRSFAGGPFFVSRMRSLGVDIGSRVRVLSKFPMMILADGKQVRIGMGMAEKIIVEEA
jgi:ferrous iron transport protein A